MPLLDNYTQTQLVAHHLIKFNKLENSNELDAELFADLIELISFNNYEELKNLGEIILEINKYFHKFDQFIEPLRKHLLPQQFTLILAAIIAITVEQEFTRKTFMRSDATLETLLLKAWAQIHDDTLENYFASIFTEALNYLKENSSVKENTDKNPNYLNTTRCKALTIFLSSLQQTKHLFPNELKKICNTIYHGTQNCLDNYYPLAHGVIFLKLSARHLQKQTQNDTQLFLLASTLFVDFIGKAFSKNPPKNKSTDPALAIIIEQQSVIYGYIKQASILAETKASYPAQPTELSANKVLKHIKDIESHKKQLRFDDNPVVFYRLMEFLITNPYVSNNYHQQVLKKTDEKFSGCETEPVILLALMPLIIPKTDLPSQNQLDTLLYIAIQHRAPLKLLDILYSYGANIHYAPAGKTLLHVALDLPNNTFEPYVKWLLSIDPDFPNKLTLKQPVLNHLIVALHKLLIENQTNIEIETTKPSTKTEKTDKKNQTLRNYRSEKASLENKILFLLKYLGPESVNTDASNFPNSTFPKTTGIDLTLKGKDDHSAVHNIMMLTDFSKIKVMLNCLLEHNQLDALFDSPSPLTILQANAWLSTQQKQQILCLVHDAFTKQYGDTSIVVSDINSFTSLQSDIEEVQITNFIKRLEDINRFKNKIVSTKNNNRLSLRFPKRNSGFEHSEKNLVSSNSDRISDRARTNSQTYWSVTPYEYKQLVSPSSKDKPLSINFHTAVDEIIQNHQQIIRQSSWKNCLTLVENLNIKNLHNPLSLILKLIRALRSSGIHGTLLPTPDPSVQYQQLLAAIKNQLPATAISYLHAELRFIDYNKKDCTPLYHYFLIEKHQDTQHTTAHALIKNQPALINLASGGKYCLHYAVKQFFLTQHPENSLLAILCQYEHLDLSIKENQETIFDIIARHPNVTQQEAIIDFLIKNNVCFINKSGEKYLLELIVKTQITDRCLCKIIKITFQQAASKRKKIDSMHDLGVLVLKNLIEQGRNFYTILFLIKQFELNLSRETQNPSLALLLKFINDNQALPFSKNPRLANYLNILAQEREGKGAIAELVTRYKKSPDDTITLSELKNLFEQHNNNQDANYSFILDSQRHLEMLIKLYEANSQSDNNVLKKYITQDKIRLETLIKLSINNHLITVAKLLMSTSARYDFGLAQLNDYKFLTPYVLLEIGSAYYDISLKTHFLDLYKKLADQIETSISVKNSLANNSVATGNDNAHIAKYPLEITKAHSTSEILIMSSESAKQRPLSQRITTTTNNIFSTFKPKTLTHNTTHNSTSIKSGGNATMRTSWLAGNHRLKKEPMDEKPKTPTNLP